MNNAINVGLPQNRQPIAEDMYTYVLRVNNVLRGTSKSFALSIEADAYFLLDKISYFIEKAGQAPPLEESRIIGLVDIQITDTGSGRNLMSDTVDLSSIAGHEGLPFIPPARRVFKPSSSVQVIFNNYSTSEDYNRIALYFHGIKYWY